MRTIRCSMFGNSPAPTMVDRRSLEKKLSRIGVGCGTATDSAGAAGSQAMSGRCSRLCCCEAKASAPRPPPETPLMAKI